MKKVINILSILFYIFVLYYFILPPINLSSIVFWIFIILSIIGSLFINGFFDLKNYVELLVNGKIVKKGSKKIYLTILLIPIIFIVILLLNFINSPLFMSKSYYERISIISSDFSSDVEQVDFNKLALLDKDSSSKLGDRVMGQITDLVSQFNVSNLYTQINYNNDIVRVTPLEYAGLIKYFTNKKNGVPGYIIVNSVTGNSELVRLNEGMKYMPSAIFGEDLYRKLRFSYPTEIFGDISFEITDEGKPYWIAPTLKYSAIGLREEVTGIVLLDPVDGSSKKYNLNEIPTWIDHVYSADLILEQVNDWGKYKNGFFNSIFGQKEVVVTTEGYNYIALNDDIYLYTGITSVVSDESNVGFILANLRTKETKFYDVAGAEEYSAMASAEGQVQQMNYTSTFPLLINLNNKPTYLMSLKDNAGLVKMYAFVDYKDYQKVVVTDSSLGIIAAAEKYLGKDIINLDTKELSIRINEISSSVIDGTTYYYLKTNDGIFRASVSINQNVLPFVKVGDTLKIQYKEGNINEIIKID